MLCRWKGGLSTRPQRSVSPHTRLNGMVGALLHGAMVIVLSA